MAIHPDKSMTAVPEPDLRELINANRRRVVATAFGSLPDLQPTLANAWESDQVMNAG